MKDRAAAERACKDPNPIIDGRKANVNLAYLGAKPRTNVQLAGECCARQNSFHSRCSCLPLWKSAVKSARTLNATDPYAVFCGSETSWPIAALANQVQLPLQTQLQALFPTRIG
ncbi:unnamed protein product [Cylicostephanus goldi]|uniref:RNA-binding protein 38 n=1 Tax=Cylicostephanus goldi TaxID=71465 RepID=A0A3P6USL9_CYLGO|nr:unnamed protein product [Cylicostephanus goldi]